MNTEPFSIQQHLIISKKYLYHVDLLLIMPETISKRRCYLYYLGYDHQHYRLTSISTEANCFLCSSTTYHHTPSLKYSNAYFFQLIIIQIIMVTIIMKMSFQPWRIQEQTPGSMMMRHLIFFFIVSFYF